MKTIKTMKNMELCLYISIKVYNSVVFFTQESKSSKIIFSLHSKNFIDKNKTQKISMHHRQITRHLDQTGDVY